MAMDATDTLTSVVERARRGDPTAFDELVDLYSSRLFGFLYRLTGSRDDADDLVQEVFVRVVQKISAYVHEGRFEAWLFRIATNLARDRIRRLKRSKPPLSGDAARVGQNDYDGGSMWEHLADPSADPPDVPMELDEDVDRLQRSLAALPTAEREVIMLRHYTAMTFAEIAAAMGTPLGTALARSHRALAKLRELMGEAG